MEKIKRKNHYVPQTYLKQWSDGEKNEIWVYELLVPYEKYPIWRQVSISRTASINYFYVYEDGETMNDEMEDYFSVIESKYNSLLSKLNNKEKLNPNDRDCLFKYIAVQSCRTLDGYDRNKKNTKSIVVKFMDDLSNDLSNNIKFMQWAKNIKPGVYCLDFDKFDILAPRIPLEIFVTKSEKSQISLDSVGLAGKSAWLFMIKSVIEEGYYKYFGTLSYYIYEALNEFDWATSDNPVKLPDTYNPNELHLYENPELIFPLSPNLLLVGFASNTPTFEYKTPSYEYALELQAFITKNALVNVYSTNESSCTSDLRQRTVDLEEFNKKRLFVKRFYDQALENDIKYKDFVKKKRGKQ